MITNIYNCTQKNNFLDRKKQLWHACFDSINEIREIFDKYLINYLINKNQYANLHE